jgi:serine/arginine repetitive matrix protein 2
MLAMCRIDEDEIEEKVAAYRSELLKNGGLHEKDVATAQIAETHEIAARKEREMEKVRHALGFKEDIVEGEAFDRELQEQKKQARIEERKRRERERIEREEERRREMKRKARELEKERQKRIEDMEKAHKAGYYQKYDRPPERYDGDVGAVDASPPASPEKGNSDPENSSSPERRRRRRRSSGRGGGSNSSKRRKGDRKRSSSYSTDS